MAEEGDSLQMHEQAQNQNKQQKAKKNDQSLTIANSSKSEPIKKIKSRIEDGGGQKNEGKREDKLQNFQGFGSSKPDQQKEQQIQKHMN